MTGRTTKAVNAARTIITMYARAVKTANTAAPNGHGPTTYFIVCDPLLSIFGAVASGFLPWSGVPSMATLWIIWRSGATPYGGEGFSSSAGPSVEAVPPSRGRSIRESDARAIRFRRRRVTNTAVSAAVTAPSEK